MRVRLPRSWLRRRAASTTPPSTTPTSTPPPSPQLRATSEAHAVEVTGGWSRPAEPAVRYAPARPPIHGDPDRWATLAERLPGVLPATRVVGLPSGRVVGSPGWVVTPDDRVVVSLSWFETFGRASISVIRWTSERHLDGSLLNLSTVSGALNYGHFLLDGLGRLAVAHHVDLGVDQFDHILVPGFDSPGARTMIERLGIPAARIVRCANEESLTADLVVTPSLPGTTRVYRPVVAELYRGLVDPAEPGGSRIMVSRRGPRRPLTNVDEVEDIAMQHGFRVLRAEDVDLPAEMAAASVVMGAHGAAMADLVFCRPATQVIELIPSDHMFPYWFSLARAGDLDYRAVIGDSEIVRPASARGGSKVSFEVPAPLLLEALGALL